MGGDKKGPEGGQYKMQLHKHGEDRREKKRKAVQEARLERGGDRFQGRTESGGTEKFPRSKWEVEVVKQ